MDLNERIRKVDICFLEVGKGVGKGKSTLAKSDPGLIPMSQEPRTNPFWYIEAVRKVDSSSGLKEQIKRLPLTFLPPHREKSH